MLFCWLRNLWSGEIFRYELGEAFVIALLSNTFCWINKFTEEEFYVVVDDKILFYCV